MRVKNEFVIPTIILISGFLFQVGLQAYMKKYAIDQFYFQEWSSETIMQTVSIEDLQNAPIDTLLHIHIQPPGLDLIRAFIIHTLPKPSASIPLEKYADYWLYKIWALFYGTLGSIAYLWLFEATKAKVFSVISAIALLLHPACLFYATFLDSTLMTSVLVLLYYYYLWRTKNNYTVSIWCLISLILALFFTRSIFQLPFIFISVLSLLLAGMPKRNALRILIITSSIASLYLVKQYHQFGIFSTSSFTGINLNHSVGNERSTVYWGYLESIKKPQKQYDYLPQTLTRKKKLTGAPNFNNIEYLKLNKELEEKFRAYILAASPSQILNSYLENLEIYFLPSSQYSPHVIVDRLAWRNIYDIVFSAPFIYLLIIISGIQWLLEKFATSNFLSSISILLPGFFIFAVSVLFEKGENYRFKFFLEPVLFIFIASQIYTICKKVLKLFTGKYSVSSFIS